MKNKLNLIVNVTLNVVLFILASIFMYNAYKCISGFIANGAADGLFMITMITSYVLPVIVYIVFFFKNYVRPFKKVGTCISSSLFIVWGIFNLVNIFMNIEAYATNNGLGVYGALNPLIVSFPYDMILVNVIVISLQILNILMIWLKNESIEKVANRVKSYGFFSFKIPEYLFISVVAILSFVFVGAFFISFKSIENILYDPKYLFLMLWVLIVPTITLLSLVLKFENKDMKLMKKNIYMGSIIGINVLFIALLFILEASSPSFIVGIGKPFFAITFSVSLPIEILILLAYGVLTALYFMVKMIIINIKAHKNKIIKIDE